MLKFVVISSFILLASGSSLTGSFRLCNLQCSNEGDAVVQPPPGGQNFLRGKSGPRGFPGAKGDPGEDCDSQVIEKLQHKIEHLQSGIDLLESFRPRNCSQIKERHPDAVTGVYELYENRRSIIGRKTLCDMNNEGAAIQPRNCKEILQMNPLSRNGVYRIQINPSTSTAVYCEMQEGGWTVFQRRFDGSQQFKQSFKEYTDGFGGITAEFWLGLEKIHQLTSQSGRWILRVDLESFDGDTAYAEYSDFLVGAGTDYILSFGEYSGNAGNSLNVGNGRKFSTPDRDQDPEADRNCAERFHGAWWFTNGCHHSNLNSYDYGSTGSGWHRVMWLGFKSTNPLKATKMKIIPAL